MPGLRLTILPKAAVIAYDVDTVRSTVYVLRVFFAGEDFETVLRDDRGR